MAKRGKGIAAQSPNRLSIYGELADLDNMLFDLFLLLPFSYGKRERYTPLYFNVIREPVDQYVSMYYFYRQQSKYHTDIFNRKEQRMVRTGPTGGEGVCLVFEISMASVSWL